MNNPITQRINSFVSDLSDLVRMQVMENVQNAFGQETPKARIKTNIMVASVMNKPTRKAVDGRSVGSKRTTDQIAATVTEVFKFIKANPKKRSEEIREAMKLDRPVLRDALDRLAAAKKIKMSGVKRGASWAVR